MSPTNPTVVRVTSLGGLADATAQSLGFTPEDSVCIVCMHGERSRFGLTMRFDFADLLDMPFTESIRGITRRIDIDAPDRVAVIVWTEQADAPSGKPFARLVNGLADALGDKLVASLLIRGSKYEAYFCADECCNGDMPTGTTAVAAAVAATGKVVRRSRADTVAALAYNGSDDLAVSTPLVDPGAVLTSLARRRIACTPIGATDVDCLVGAALDITRRDKMLVVSGDNELRTPALDVLIMALRRVPDGSGMVAPVASLVAWFAYCDGDGVTASIALDRAFADDEDYTLAKLIDDAVRQQVPPTMLQEAAVAAKADLH